jgi:two-component system CheB/CheR fusion protein
LEAFSELLRNLPATTGMAFVLVQHLDPTHPSILADLLGNCTEMPVIQAHGDVPIQADHVYVSPPNATMLLVDGMLRVTRPAQEFSHQRRPIDAFFVSLAESMRHRAIGIVLSGAASDGTVGLKAIKAEGGLTYAQDATAKFDSMPKSAIAAGGVDFILPPNRIARELATIARHPLANPNSAQFSVESSTLNKIRAILRQTNGVDFALYKQPTVQRRLAHRMMAQKVDTLESYLDVLQHDPVEADALFDDLLIKVTEFFRDPPVFDALRTEVFPFLAKDRAEGEPLRIWVPGCSTGEEIYSIAISLLEYLEAENRSLSVYIFGSDASERVIAKARTGIYNDSIVSTVSPERLRRFFIRSDSDYQVNSRVRSMCVFSRHILGVDPPLSHMDLISCRNLLIYFTPALQQMVIQTLAYALNPTGYLLVGTSENVGRLSEFFDAVDEEHRIYRRKSSLDPRALSLIPNLAGPLEPKFIPAAKPFAGHQGERGGVNAFVDQMLLTRYGPSAVVVDQDFRIIEFRGNMKPYLRDPAGEATLDLLNVVREDLASHLSAAIREAHQQRHTVRLEIQVRRDKGFHFVRITLVPIFLPEAAPHTVILFEDLADSAELLLKRASIASPKLEDGASFDTPERHIEHLERELASSREYLQSIIEELRSTNEEAQSANEELQSSNEELQTTKEEIQSSNEELATVNAEVAARNIQLIRVNDDLTNLLSSLSGSAQNRGSPDQPASDWRAARKARRSSRHSWSASASRRRPSDGQLGD